MQEVEKIIPSYPTIQEKSVDFPSMASNCNLIEYFSANVDAIGCKTSSAHGSEYRTGSECLESGLQLQHLYYVLSARSGPGASFSLESWPALCKDHY
ncbi:hypothetical protein [Thalassovita mangrovi]|uniref:Uncharacterized protein n=1 Tax=Thalassovita mangrovi TaxID=2692236 RepID=A0A6L8LN54_9RHOB|nr:hypothetical protein [Thalassovita mangrovi]MYM56973.1 hypothetical protein [Thalassovita mangrovi]